MSLAEMAWSNSSCIGSRESDIVQIDLSCIHQNVLPQCRVLLLFKIASLHVPRHRWQLYHYTVQIFAHLYLAA